MGINFLKDYWKSYIFINVDIISFYGAKNTDNIYSCFSNFYYSPFEYILPIYLSNNKETIYCETSEKAIMLSKALLFNDYETFEKIKKTTSPNIAKKLGRSVKNFDNVKWDNHVIEITYNILIQKFSQNKKIHDILLSTYNKILAEGSPTDKKWGVGIYYDNNNIKDITKWNGLNLMGYILMNVRYFLIGK